MQGQMAATAERAGFPMRFTGADGGPAMMWNTFEAHKLLRWALVTEGAEAQTRLKLALLRAHFQQGARIGEQAVLLDVAAAEGFDRAAAEAALADETLGAAVRQTERQGQEMGITAVPSFVIASRYLVQGALEPEVYAQALRQAAATAPAGGRSG
jgi:predicted DsbA family dithiol-disulfide isomerase